MPSTFELLTPYLFAYVSLVYQFAHPTAVDVSRLVRSRQLRYPFATEEEASFGRGSSGRRCFSDVLHRGTPLFGRAWWTPDAAGDGLPAGFRRLHVGWGWCEAVGHRIGWG